jgi:signal recognition particle receptor subunit beta
MATINFATREITAKIVYFGASGAGSNTNVQRLYEVLDGDEKSKLHKFGPGDVVERSWYFDYVPGGQQEVNGFRLCYRIYSLPGGLQLEAHREEVIDESDALVFVSDARPTRNSTNLDSMLELETLLSATGLQLATLPVVLQVNHSDHADARPPEDVAYDLNPYGFPVVSSCARDGTGVLATHEEVTAVLVARIRDNLSGSDAAVSLTAVHQPERESDFEIIRKHIDAITAHSPSTPPELVDDVTGPPLTDDPSLLGGERIAVPFQHPAYVGCYPARVLAATVEGDTVRIDLAMQPMNPDEPPRRLSVELENRPADTPPLLRRGPSEAQTAPPAEGRVFDYLPESVALEKKIDALDDDGPRDLPGLWYGVLGTAGGVVIGGLLGYLFGLF